MHATVLGAVPSQPVRERVLWRVDAHDPRRPALLVLTRSRPSWEHVNEQAGWRSLDDPADPSAAIRDYQPLLDRLSSGHQYAFRLSANPVQSTKRPEAPTPSQRSRAVDGVLSRSARVGHRSLSHQVAWLTARAERWGFEIPAASSSGSIGEEVADLRVVGRTRYSFRRSGSPGNVTLQVVTYEGRLLVADAEALRSAMMQGLGPAKAYGCGLLTLAPLPRGIP